MANADPQAPSALRPDFSTFLGLFIAFAGIVGGLILEGGRIADVAQITAMMIVLGGTVGAVLVTTPLPVCLRAIKSLRLVFFEHDVPRESRLDHIVVLAGRARKNGLVSLENEADREEHQFLRKALSMAVDGAEVEELRGTMQLQIDMDEQFALREAKVFECAGGYAPTIGIIGAVLGLIQVMKHLENIQEVGQGIAVAFVATVYGVGLANLVFLPAANKIKSRISDSTVTKEMMLEGVCSIMEGLNPRMIERKLSAFLDDASNHIDFHERKKTAGIKAA